jgi:magnesium-transporting ATPase (P-type)
MNLLVGNAFSANQISCSARAGHMYKRPKPKPSGANLTNQLLLRIVGLYAAIVVISFFLGTGFFFILFSLVSVALWFADDWEPAYWMMITLLRVHPASGGFYPRSRNLWRATLIIIKAGVIVYCLFLGISILSRGFLEQNIIYLLLRN